LNPTTIPKRILLLMLPYWTPLIPPQGLGMLKAHLIPQGHKVLTSDLNTADQFRDIYDSYFALLKEHIPQRHQANLYNIGHDVLHNHMTAATRVSERSKHRSIVRALIWHTFYVAASEELVEGLIALVLDFYKELDNFLDKIVRMFTPDVVGFSVLKGTVPASMYAATRIRRALPEATIIFGGGTFADSHSVGSPNFDTLVKETEGTVDHILIGGQGELMLDAILTDQPTERVVTLTSLGLTPLSFAELPTADLSDFEIDRYPYLAATGSGSCPMKCSFCNASVFFGRYIRKNNKQLITEMVELSHRYGRQIFFLTDSLLNPIIDRLSSAFIKHDDTIYYDCYFRVDRPSGKLDNTFQWRRGGLYRTRIGVESGSQRVLDMMHKGITVQQTRDTLYALATAGIKTTAYMVIGHPGETEDDFQATLDLMTEMKDFIWQAEPNPFYYHYAGQFESDSWAEHRQLLYPESMRDELLFDTWTLDMEPLREERYERLRRFTEHCRELGIPNPYSGRELYEADQRWASLHRNAVPGIWEFETFGARLNEAKYIQPQQKVHLNAAINQTQFQL